jgi:hypothetical protein
MAREFDPLGFDLLLQLLSDDSGAPVENINDEDRRLKASERYRLLWSKIDFFLERRGCLDHEDAADETICRVTSLLPVERERIKSIHAFCLGVARLISREYLRIQNRAEQMPEDYLDNPPPPLVTYPDSVGWGASDSAIEHMRDCFGKLSLEDQELMTRYELNERSGRQKLANGLGISLKALQERRVFSIRRRLRRCLNDNIGRCPEKAKRLVSRKGR